MNLSMTSAGPHIGMMGIHCRVLMLLLVVAAPGCGSEARTGEAEEAAARADRIVRAEWLYDQMIVPQGDDCPLLENRCRIVLPGAGVGQEVTCGLVALAVAADADDLQVQQLATDLDARIVESPPTVLASASGAGTRLVLLSVPVGEESRVLRQAMAMPMVRSVDVLMVRGSEAPPDSAIPVGSL